MTSEDLVVVTLVAVIFGPLFGFAALGALRGNRQIKRSTGRARGHVLSVPPFDDDASTVEVQLAWSFQGRQHHGPVRIPTKLVGTQDAYDLRIDPQRPEVALLASERPSRLGLAFFALFGLGAAVFLVGGLLQLLGVRAPWLQAGTEAGGMVVAGAFGLLLVSCMVGVAIGGVVMALRELWRAVSALARGRVRTGLSHLAWGALMVGFLAVAAVVAANSLR